MFPTEMNLLIPTWPSPLAQRRYDVAKAPLWLMIDTPPLRVSGGTLKVVLRPV